MKVSDPKKFAKITARVKDLAGTHSGYIETNSFIRIAACFLAEAQWLVKEVERLSGTKASAKVPDEEPVAV